MRIIGIDAGSKGAIVELDSVKRTCRCLDMPFIGKDMLDYDKMNRWFPIPPNAIFIEDVYGREHWGVTNAFTFGYNTGLISAWLYGKNYKRVLPKTWQKIAHLGEIADDPKLRSWLSFQRMNPNAKIKKSNDGLIDAFHVARYGLLMHRCVFRDNWEFIKCP